MLFIFIGKVAGYENKRELNLQGVANSGLPGEEHSDDQ
jgi:hypothetical protein